MPEHPNCPGLKCQIYCNGRPLAEIDPPSDEVLEPLTVVKYVVPEDDSEYFIKVEFSEPFPPKQGVQAVVSIDGERCTCRVYSVALGSHTNIYGAEDFNGVVWKLRRFRFSKISIDEHAKRKFDSQLGSQLGSIGVIRLELSWWTRIGKEPATKSETTLNPTGDVPKKAILRDFRSHQTLLGEPESLHDSAVFVIGDEGARFAVFEFKYRSIPLIAALAQNLQEQQLRSGTASGQREPPHEPEPIVKQEVVVKQEPDEGTIDLTSDDEETGNTRSKARAVIELSSGEESSSNEEITGTRGTIAKEEPEAEGEENDDGTDVRRRSTRLANKTRAEK